MIEKIILTSEPSTVELIQYMGNDRMPVNAALIKSLNDYEWGGKEDALQEGLIKEGHWGCYEHNVVTLRIACPIITARQFVRARTFSFNEASGRYSVLKPLFYVPEILHENVKRKELGNTPTPHMESNTYKAQLQESYQSSWNTYVRAINAGVKKEQARLSVPPAVYTSFWVTGNLRNWMHFLNLRTDTHAQYEINYCAQQIEEILNKLFPITMENWRKYGKGPINDYGTIQTA